MKDVGFGNGKNATDPANTYQYHVSWYPEKKLPLRPGDGHGSYIDADGLRNTDGMIVEAKDVKKSNTCETPRLLSKYLDTNKKPWVEGTHEADDEEMDKYRQAIDYPPNKARLRGVEVCTNDQGSVDYWDALMIANDVPGYARHVP